MKASRFSEAQIAYVLRQVEEGTAIGEVCRSASIVLGGVAPVPWRVPDAEQILVGQHVTPALAARAAEVAVAGASPLSKNGYKVGLTRGVVERTIGELSRRRGGPR